VTTSFNRVLGEAQYIPIFGEEGVIIYLGGDKPTSRDYVIASSVVDMSTITVYDIKSGNYYDQTTVGSTIPTPRSGFCSVAVTGSNATYEM
jgi:hypothetical protein